MSESLEKKEYYTNLFDFYESLFTDKQIEYFKEYYFFDLSLSEISENHNISRAAVHDVITKMHNALDEYEKNLGLYTKYNKMINLCNEYEEKGKDNPMLLEFISKIKENG
ncbi:MAG: hypothetical protein J5666_07755 [Bacilli bacterium]|nr:hypothetical protein [Bacilli bacterium]